MGITEEKVTDMTAGVYRRIYGGFLLGKRINAVSLEAEAWFWRLNAIADDFGNLVGDETLVYSASSGRRRVSLVQVTRFIDELIAGGLVESYVVDGDRYLHIIGFEARQPAGKNGKRTKRYPAPDRHNGTSDGGKNIATGESRCIQNNPGVSSASHSHSEDHYHSHSQGGGDPLEEGWIFAGITEALNHDDFKAAFRDWVELHRQKDKDRKVPPIAVRKALSRCNDMGRERSIAALNHSVSNNYSGIVEPRNGKANGSHGAPPKFRKER